ncbi:MAG: hypothetical protein J6B59_00490 [Alistipes sp.]|nr:hypothetical protein [Alistipes sp.]MBQ2728731.1 hypothetical protein [Alistipes sp.]MBQ8916831.1 hypothetical protein [Alistipes sp.]
MKRFIFLTLALLVSVATLSAKEEEKQEKQKTLSAEERTALILKTLKERDVELVINPWGGKGAECKELTKTANGYVAYTENPKVFFERGYTFKPITFIDDYRYVFEEEGKYYGVSMSEIRVKDSDDAEALEFMMRGKSKLMSSMAGRFYGTTAALKMMLLVMGIAAVVAFLYLFCGIKTMRPLFLAVIPAAILVFSLIEIYGYAKFGSHIFWWCDYDRYGFFGSLWRVIPFGLMVAAQVASIRLYERALFEGNDDPTDDDRKISLKPAAWSLALCIPVFIILLLLVTALGLGNTILMDIAGIGGFLGTLGVGLYISFKRNVKSFGRLTGLWVTIFSIVYIIGCIISAIAMIVLIFKIILQILMVMAAIVIFAMMGYRRRVYRNGRVYEEVY